MGGLTCNLSEDEDEEEGDNGEEDGDCWATEVSGMLTASAKTGSG
jgi:hypothetical protein